MKEPRRKYCSVACFAAAAPPTHTPERDAAYNKKIAERKTLFLAKLAEHGTVSVAAKYVGIIPKTAYSWRKADPEFAAAWHDATESAMDVAEQWMYDRHVHGVKEPIFYKGRQVGERVEYDTRAGEFILKGRRPEIFGDKLGISHSGHDGGPLRPSLTAVQVIIPDTSMVDMKKELARIIEATEHWARAAPEILPETTTDPDPPAAGVPPDQSSPMPRTIELARR